VKVFQAVGLSETSHAPCSTEAWYLGCGSVMAGVRMWLDGGCGCAGSIAMSILDAAKAGDLAEVERLVGQDPGQLDVSDFLGWTPLIVASREGHVGVVRWLSDKGAAINNSDRGEFTALWHACCHGRTPVVKLLLERGADLTIANRLSSTSLNVSAGKGHLEIVRLLLGHPGAKATMNQRDIQDKTALWRACFWGHGGVARALVEGGADPTITDDNGTTPMAIAKQDPGERDIRSGVSAEGGRECVAALEVRCSYHRFLYYSAYQLG
jgi:hypothetical protein